MSHPESFTLILQFISQFLIKTRDVYLVLCVLVLPYSCCFCYEGLTSLTRNLVPLPYKMRLLLFFCVDLILKIMVSLAWMVWSLHIFDGIDDGFLISGIDDGFVVNGLIFWLTVL